MRALGHPAQRERRRLRRARRRRGRPRARPRCAARLASTKRPSMRAPELRDLLVVGRDLDDRAQQDAVLGVERGDVGERLAHLGLGLAVAGEPDVGLLVEQLVDLLGEAHEQLALVAEVEVERGARDARARRDALDVEVGVRGALGEQRLGRGEDRGLDRRALGGGGRSSRDSTDAIAPSVLGATGLTQCQVSARIRAHGQPARPHHPGRRRDDHRRVQAPARHS